MVTEPCQRILIVTADIASCGLNFEEPESAALLGDGAAAAVLTPTPPGEASRFHAFHLETCGKGADLTRIRGGGSAKHPNHPDTVAEDNMFHMKGLQVLKLTRQYGAKFLEKLRPRLSENLGDIKWVVPHQASKMGLLMLAEYGWTEDNMIITLGRFGNCVAASIPISLYEAVHRDLIHRGDEVLLVGTGAGLSIGGLILTH